MSPNHSDLEPPVSAIQVHISIDKSSILVLGLVVFVILILGIVEYIPLKEWDYYSITGCETNVWCFN